MSEQEIRFATASRPLECPHCGLDGSKLEEKFGGWECPDCGKRVGKW